MWSYTAYREIKTLRSDLVASQVALKDSQHSVKLEKKVFSQYDDVCTNFISWTRDNAFFKDVENAKVMFGELDKAIMALARKYNRKV